MNFSTQPKNTPASVAGLSWPALRRRTQPLRHFPARQLPSVEDDYEKGTICCWQRRERGALAWQKGPKGAPIAPSMVFNSLAKAHAVAKQWSQDANPNLLKLLSLHRHGLAYLSYSSKLYTVSGVFFFFFISCFVPDTMHRAEKGSIQTRSGMRLYLLNTINF